MRRVDFYDGRTSCVIRNRLNILRLFSDLHGGTSSNGGRAPTEMVAAPSCGVDVSSDKRETPDSETTITTDPITLNLPKPIQHSLQTTKLRPRSAPGRVCRSPTFVAHSNGSMPVLLDASVEAGSVNRPMHTALLLTLPHRVSVCVLVG